MEQIQKTDNRPLMRVVMDEEPCDKVSKVSFESIEEELYRYSHENLLLLLKRQKVTIEDEKSTDEQIKLISEAVSIATKSFCRMHDRIAPKKEPDVVPLNLSMWDRGHEPTDNNP